MREMRRDLPSSFLITLFGLTTLYTLTPSTLFTPARQSSSHIMSLLHWASLTPTDLERQLTILGLYLNQPEPAIICIQC